MPFTVTYNGNGATEGSVPVDTNSYATGTQVTVPGNTGNLTKTGGKFARWNTEADGSGCTYGWPDADSFTIGTSDVTLYAQWYNTAGLADNFGRGPRTTPHCPVLDLLGSLSGTVTSADGGGPIAGAVVTAGLASGPTDATGAYHLPSLDPGAISVAATAPGFDPVQAQVRIAPGAQVVQDIALTPASATLTGTVTSGLDGRPYAGATVAIAGVGAAQTDDTGSYTLSGIPAGDHDVTASGERVHSIGWEPDTVSIHAIALLTRRQEFILFPLYQPKPNGDFSKNYERDRLT